MVVLDAAGLRLRGERTTGNGNPELLHYDITSPAYRRRSYRRQQSISWTAVLEAPQAQHGIFPMDDGRGLRLAPPSPPVSVNLTAWLCLLGALNLVILRKAGGEWGEFRGSAGRAYYA
ncbi:hypothetical protein ANO14919_133840 [Xylariales sp. No.14919]|nr:hypothetical protein ANO14919_133840 [Xylariales sp. No.14919]